MNRTLLFFFVLFFSTYAQAQKFAIGLKPALDVGFFEINDKATLTAGGFRNPSTLGGSFAVFADYSTSEKLKIRFAPTIGIKQIRFIEDVPGISNQNSNFLAIEFFTLELGISGRYIMTNNSWRMTPHAGLNFGFNKHHGTSFTARNPSANSSFIVDGVSTGSTFAPEKINFNPGISLGFDIGPKNRNIELSTQFVFSPVDFFKEEITIPLQSNEGFPFEGKFQYLSIGLNFY